METTIQSLYYENILISNATCFENLSVKIRKCSFDSKCIWKRFHSDPIKFWKKSINPADRLHILFPIVGNRNQLLWNVVQLDVFGYLGCWRPAAVRETLVVCSNHHFHREDRQIWRSQRQPTKMQQKLIKQEGNGESVLSLS